MSSAVCWRSRVRVAMMSLLSASIRPMPVSAGERLYCWHPMLDRQHRLSTLLRQLHFKGIEEEGRLGVVAHQRRQFRQVLSPELIQGCLECRLADLVSLEKLCGVVDHRRFSRAHRWKGATLPQCINQGVA